MVRRIGVTVLVSLLVVLAGCSGGSGGDPADGTMTGAVAGGDGTTAGGESDVSLVENRTAALMDAGSYTSLWEMEYAEDGAVVGKTSYTHAVDYENERSAFGMVMANDGEVSNDYGTYHADGTTYARYGTSDEATYQTTTGPFAPENTLFSVQSYVADADDLSEFDAVGTETYDGVTVTRYERTDRPTWVSAQNTEDDFTWEEFTYTVLVDEDGLVRLESWSGEGVTTDGVTRTITFTYSLTAVGSTTVAEPDWVDAAREQAEQ